MTELERKEITDLMWSEKYSLTYGAFSNIAHYESCVELIHELKQPPTIASVSGSASSAVDKTVSDGCNCFDYKECIKYGCQNPNKKTSA